MHVSRLLCHSLLFAAALAAPPLSAQPFENDHAVILMYHHVSESTPPSTSVTPQQFEAHLDYLADNGFAVLPLERIAAALKEKRPLPPKAVALTFDDGYRSVYDEALPRLRRRGWPFTVFVSTDAIDAGQPPYLSWDHLRELDALGGTIANHTTDHAHLVRRRPGESNAAWKRRVRDNIQRAQARLEREIESPPRLFAYPYGEFDADLEALLEELDMVAFGQQSGPAGWSSDLYSVPRFPVARAFADIRSLSDKLNSRPIPLTVRAPDSRILPGDPVRPVLELEIPPGTYRRGAMRCYVAGQDPAEIVWRDDLAVIRAVKPLGAGRTKYNCTMPSAVDPGVYHWYSYLWIKPNFDGSWYSE